ncbi:MAG: hypothetical protein JO101_00205 [Candidatus Eremiobacteraeota bacterium]|nr:hypothetical protein [Candidatus Eremiobacteraeota bacterium]
MTLMSAPNLAWVPLAPGEPLQPWWGPSPTTVFYNVTNVQRIYVNARRPGAARWMERRQFANGWRRNFRAVDARDLSRVAVARGPLPVVPTVQSLRFTPRGIENAHLAPNAFRAFRTAPRPPGTFAQDRQRVTAFASRPESAQHFAAPQQQRVAPRPEQQHFAAPQPQQQRVAPRPQQQHFAAPQQQVPPQQRVAPQRVAPQRAAPAQHAAPAQRGQKPSGSNQKDQGDQHGHDR